MCQTEGHELFRQRRERIGTFERDLAGSVHGIVGEALHALTVDVDDFNRATDCGHLLALLRTLCFDHRLQV